MLVETKAKVAVFSAALGAYLPQFPELVPEYESQYADFVASLPNTVEVIDGGMCTTKEAAAAAGDKFRAAQARRRLRYANLAQIGRPYPGMMICKVLSGSCQLSGFYTFDFNDDVVLIGHSGSGDACFSTARKASMEIVPVFHGKAGGGFLTRFACGAPVVSVLVVGAFVGIHGLVGAGEDVFKGTVVCGVVVHQATRDGEFCGVGRARVVGCDGGMQFAAALFELARVCVACDYRELVAANAVTAPNAETLRDGLRRSLDVRVPAFVAVGVVELLKAVNVENREPEVCRSPRNLVFECAQGLVTGIGVTHFGEGVGVGLCVQIIEAATHLALHGTDLAAKFLQLSASTVAVPFAAASSAGVATTPSPKAPGSTGSGSTVKAKRPSLVCFTA